ncbi:hypothetical protein CVT26_012707, partial [Gymnopilus dilepis]
VTVSDTITKEEQHRWYAVVVGRDPGVFNGSSSITSNVQRIPGAQVVKCISEAEARQIFETALDAGQVEKVELVLNRSTLSRADFE